MKLASSTPGSVKYCTVALRGADLDARAHLAPPKHPAVKASPDRPPNRPWSPSFLPRGPADPLGFVSQRLETTLINHDS
jgi:hypothetical protein